MEASLWVALAIAVLAAGASIFGAWRSERSATRAEASAEGIDRRRHLVEALDSETASFREAAASLLSALGGEGADIPVEKMLGIVLARGEVLRIHSLATSDVDGAVGELLARLADIALNQQRGDIDRSVVGLRDAVRAVLHDQADERRLLLNTSDRLAGSA